MRRDLGSDGRSGGRLRVAGRWLYPAWLTANIRIVLVTRLAMSAARALSGVVIALYLATQGFSAVAIGAVFVAVTVASAVLSAGVGVLADRLGRKPFLVVLPLLGCAAAVAFTVLRAPGAYQPADSALLADSTAARKRTTAFARLMFCSALGAVLGTVLANLVDAGIREQPRPRESHTTGRLVLPTRSWSVLWRLSATNAVNGVGMVMSYWLYRRFGAGPGTIGLLFATANVASLVSVLTAPRVGRHGTIRAIVVIRVAQAVLLITVAWAPTFAAASAIYVGRLLVSRVGLPLRQSYVQGVADTDERARLAALSRLPAQGTQTGGHLLAGYLFEQASLAAPFTLAGVVQLVNAAMYAGLLGRFRPEWEQRQEQPAATSTTGSKRGRP